MTYDPKERKLYELRKRRAGGHIRVDAGPAREHLRALAERASLSSIAAQAGLAQSTVSRLNAGHHHTIDPRTARAILALDDDATPPTGRSKVRAVGTMRRLRALRALGYSLRDLSRVVDVTGQGISWICAGRTHWVHADVRDRVAAAYDLLSLKLPPARTGHQRGAAFRARRRAAEQGWLPPLAYDDDTIDDPAAEPDAAAVRLGDARTAAETAEDVEWVLKHEPLTTAARLADRLGYADSDGVYAALRRAGRRDLLDRLARNAELAGAAA
ncbi:MAG: hypothetical protein HOQ27_15920 [Dermatophilaceae bacterium]|nr:hypothetical protein [Dermatophilaceae bacterium]